MQDISLHILDIIQNAFNSNPSIITIKIVNEVDLYKIFINDNGCGICEKDLVNIKNPFFTTRKTRKVGLGIALFEQSCMQTGGSLTITSKLNQGTEVIAEIYKNHLDSLPLGNLTEVIYLTLIQADKINVIFEYIDKSTHFCLDLYEIKEVLNGLPLTNNEVMKWLKEYIQSGIS